MFLHWHVFRDPSVGVVPHIGYCPITSVSGTISTNSTFTGCRIEVNNTTITNNAYVIVDANQSTTINGPFEVQIGSTLVVQ